jgi:hypothetical protein
MGGFPLKPAKVKFGSVSHLGSADERVRGVV